MVANVTRKEHSYVTVPPYRIAGNIRWVQSSFFSFSVYQNKNLTPEMYVTMGVFSCVKWQNEN